MCTIQYKACNKSSAMQSCSKVPVGWTGRSWRSRGASGFPIQYGYAYTSDISMYCTTLLDTHLRSVSLRQLPRGLYRRCSARASILFSLVSIESKVLRLHPLQRALASHPRRLVPRISSLPRLACPRNGRECLDVPAPFNDPTTRYALTLALGLALIRVRSPRRSPLAT